MYTPQRRGILELAETEQMRKQQKCKCANTATTSTKTSKPKRATNGNTHNPETPQNAKQTTASHKNNAIMQLIRLRKKQTNQNQTAAEKHWQNARKPKNNTFGFVFCFFFRESKNALEIQKRQH